MGRKSALKTSPHNDAYQIWYGGVIHAVDVKAAGILRVWRLTRRMPERWRNQPAVKTYTRRLYAVRVGDVIVDPDLKAWQVHEDRFEYILPPAPIAKHLARHAIESPTEC